MSAATRVGIPPAEKRRLDPPPQLSGRVRIAEDRRAGKRYENDEAHGARILKLKQSQPIPRRKQAGGKSGGEAGRSDHAHEYVEQQKTEVLEQHEQRQRHARVMEEQLAAPRPRTVLRAEVYERRRKQKQRHRRDRAHPRCAPFGTPSGQQDRGRDRQGAEAECNQLDAENVAGDSRTECFRKMGTRRQVRRPHTRRRAVADIRGPKQGAAGRRAASSAP